ncbi:MAG: class I SAM-dependent methyltransferase [Streptomycetaceae bacterium]|nr:class I SAM-dependent methyltransferase [Streptomycetaceae bacterium]
MAQHSHDTAHGRQHSHQHDHQHDHQHGHHDHAPQDIDWEAFAAELERGTELHDAALRQVASWLGELRRGTGGEAPARVLDVGSGPGVVACLLAEAFPDAEVVAVDQAPGLLARAEERAAKQGLDRVRTHRADLPEGFAALPEADLIWTSNAVHHLGDQQAALDSLAARLRPGGVLAVLEGGLPPRYLPRDIGLGRPGLQARLDAANQDLFAAMRADLPGTVAAVEDWPAMLAASGLVPSGSRTFLTDLPAPLGDPARAYLHTRLTRLRDRLADRLAPEDTATLDTLVDTDNPSGILRRPDAFYLEATTVHTARAPRTS